MAELSSSRWHLISLKSEIAVWLSFFINWLLPDFGVFNLFYYLLNREVTAAASWCINPIPDVLHSVFQWLGSYSVEWTFWRKKKNRPLIGAAEWKAFFLCSLPSQKVTLSWLLICNLCSSVEGSLLLCDKTTTNPVHLFTKLNTWGSTPKDLCRKRIFGWVSGLSS